MLLSGNKRTIMAESIDNKTKLTPYFTLLDAESFVDYMVTVFGAKVIKDSRNPNGTIQHARLKIEDSIIMLNQAVKNYPPNQSQMHLYVESVESIYNLALASGSESLMAPMLRSHGDKMAGFKDPFGNVWWVAEKKE